MKALIARMVLGLSIMLSAACQGAAPSTTVIPTATLATAPLESTTGENFSLNITGGIELTIPPGMASVGRDIATGEGLALTISSPPEDDNTFTFTLFMPDDIQPGDYTLTTGSASEGEVTAQVTYFIGENLSMLVYDSNFQGTLTLTETGEHFSGTLTASGMAADGTAVNIDGGFTGLTQE